MDKWQAHSQESQWEDDMDSEDECELVLEETRAQVLEWMKTYGRQFIREWMADNAKAILASDGLFKAKEGPRKLVATSSKTSSAKKVPAKPLNVTQEIVNIE